MFSRFICFNFMKTGKCEDPTCTLKHVSDISKLDSTFAPRKQPVTKTTEEKEEGFTEVKSKKATKKETVEERKRPLTAAATMLSGSSEESSFVTSGSRLKGKMAMEEKKKKKEEEEKKRIKDSKCKFLFEKGSCRMGDKCFYSHEGYVPGGTSSSKSIAESASSMRGGRRGGYPSGERGGFRGGYSRGGRGGISDERVRRERIPLPRRGFVTAEDIPPPISSASIKASVTGPMLPAGVLSNVEQYLK
jgi:hypothetical protein